jgi:hypothetical protein
VFAAILLCLAGFIAIRSVVDSERKLSALAKNFEGLLCVRRIPYQ